MTKLFDFLSNTGDGVIAMNDEQEIVFWNQTAVEMLGYATDEVLGKRCFHFFNGRTADGHPFCSLHCSCSQQASRQQPVDPFKVIVRHKDGRSLLLDISTLSIPPGEAASIVHLFRVIGDAPSSVFRLRIYLLGQILVRRADGTFLSGKLWRQTKVRALLAYLAIHYGSPVPREELMELLWPDKSAAVARHNLYTAVYNLRRCIEPDLERANESRYILQENYSYRLNGGGTHWIDIRAFEASLRHARHETNTQSALSAYQTALELYQGEFLAHIGSTLTWHSPEQARLRELFLSGMEEFGSLLLQSQDEEAAQTVYEQILAHDPCRESAARQLMRLHWQHGSRTSALTVFKQLEQVLQEDLNLKPDKQTRMLYGRIINRA